MLKFAFYKAPGDLTDRVIRLASRSQYSHVEFVTQDGLCISASKRDGKKVRAKVIDLDPARWDVVEVSGDYDKAAAFAGWMAGQAVPYDMAGAVTSVLPFSFSFGGAVFCSELMGLICIAGGYHVHEPWRLSPGELHTILRRP